MKHYKEFSIISYIIIVTTVLFLLFKSWGYDDPYITYRYSKNLAHGLGFVYNLNQKTLSTTTPLFTIILAITSKVWNNLPELAVLYSCFSIAVSGLIFYEIAKIWKAPWIGYTGLLLYPTFPLVNSTISSETPLYIAFALLSFYFYLKKDFISTGIVSSAVVLTRPDGLIVPAILFLHYIINKGKITQNPIIGIILFFLITGIWFAFSWIYFGDPLPVTLSVKQSQGNMAISQKFAEGFLTILKPYNRFPYIITFFINILGFIYAIFRKRAPLLFLAWNGLYFLSYSILGVTRYFWYYAPLITGFIMLIGLGFEWLNNKRIPTIILLIILVFTFILQARDVWVLHLRPDNRLMIYQDIGKWINNNTEVDSSVGILEVGIVGYYANRTMVDFAGLIQPEISKNFNINTTYEDAAIWAIKKYTPTYVVLHDGLFPHVEELIFSCSKEKTFYGRFYNYPYDMSIYKCQ